MTFSPPNTLETALPENVSFAEEWEPFREQWTNLYRKVAYKINDKERSLYPEALEILNNQKYFVAGNSQAYRSVFRKVFNFGAIAAGAALNIVHDIAGIVDVTRFYANVLTAVPDYRPVPYSSIVAINQGIEMNLAGLNIVITNGAGAPNIVRGICVLEFLKQ